MEGRGTCGTLTLKQECLGGAASCPEDKPNQQAGLRKNGSQQLSGLKFSS